MISVLTILALCIDLLVSASYQQKCTAMYYKSHDFHQFHMKEHILGCVRKSTWKGLKVGKASSFSNINLNFELFYNPVTGFYLCILNTRRSFHLRLTTNTILTMWAQIYFKPFFAQCSFTIKSLFVCFYFDAKINCNWRNSHKSAQVTSRAPPATQGNSTGITKRIKLNIIYFIIHFIIQSN